MRLTEIVNYNEFRDCVVKINKWYLKSSKLLTIKTIPYNSTLIYSNIINDVIDRQGSILYVWGKNTSNYNLINNIKLKNSNVTYSYLEKGMKNIDITFVSFDNINNIRGYYELCIIDDISSFSLINREELTKFIELMYLYSKRIILYSIEMVMPMGEKIELSSLTLTKPFIEPRILNTRVNLSKDIPYILYDYLLWFKNNNRRVIIYVQSEEQVDSLAYYYSKMIKFEGVKIIKHIKKQSTNLLKSLLKNKDRAVFIITNHVDDYLEDIPNKDVIVILSGEWFCSYKKMIYLCAEVTNNEEQGEVLLVSKDTTSDMEISKKISREFNRVIWEKNLLK